MSSTTASFNATIICKLSWMSRQLRRFDHMNDLIQWVNTMHSVKALLFPLPSVCCPGTAKHMNSWISESSSVSLPNLPPTVNTLPGVSVPVPPSLANYPQAIQRSTSYQLDWVPLSEEPLKSSPRTACSTTLQISPVLNVSIPPSFQTMNTTRLEATNDTTSTFCPRLAELTVAPLTPFTNTPEEKIIQHLPTPAQTSPKKDEHSNSKQMMPGEHLVGCEPSKSQVARLCISLF